MAVGEPDYVRPGFDLENSTNRNKEGENHDVCGEEEERKWIGAFLYTPPLLIDTSYLKCTRPCAEASKEKGPLEIYWRN